MELENARDDLMFEVHKIRSDKTEYDKNVSVFICFSTIKTLYSTRNFYK